MQRQVGDSNPRRLSNLQVISLPLYQAERTCHAYNNTSVIYAIWLTLVSGKIYNRAAPLPAMTKWKKNATAFEVAVNTLSNRNGGSTQVCTIPKPVYERLNEPGRLEFRIVGRRIEIHGV